MTTITIPYAGIYRPDTPTGVANAERVIALIAEQDNAFSRAALAGHITGSTVIVNQDYSAMLMTHHARLDRYFQLGGHCDGIRDPYYVALKEGYEESGLTRINPVSNDILDIDIHTIPTHKHEPEHLHYDIRYLFQADDRDELVVSSESKSLHWVAFSELPSFSQDDSVLRFPRLVKRLLAPL